MSDATSNAELELERFRAQWREEVNARNKQPQTAESSRYLETKAQRRKNADPQIPAASSSGRPPREAVDHSEDIEPRAYHDLPNKEDQLRLGEEGQNHDRDVVQEPSSALEHYEKAVEKETQGHLSESIRHYRRAFKLDDGVHEEYKKKYFPPSSFKPKPAHVNPSNAPVTVPNTAHHSLHGSDTGKGVSASLKQLIGGFSNLRIEAPPPPTDASPEERSLLGELPEEILTQILEELAIVDVTAFARCSQVCKRLAFLTMTEEGIWRRVAMNEQDGFPAMLYNYACDIQGFPLEANDEIARFLRSEDGDWDSDAELPPTAEYKAIAFSTITEQLLRSTYASSWRQMFRARPRIRFNGCYISTVNYTRAGANSTNTLSWGAPVHIVTYFRYLRFFPDGTVISLLTTSEPVDVVHHLTKDNLHNHHGNTLPSTVMKDALRGRWRLTGPASSVADPITGEKENEGEVHVETDGVVSKYTYKMLLAMSHAGKAARNNKLAWKGFWSHNRLTDDWAEFSLKNDRAFYWSRVKSYRVGQEG